MTEMIQYILDHFPVRKSEKQKEGFRLWLVHRLKAMGYKPELERKSSTVNVVCGDVRRARWLVSTHYDTCASVGLPNPAVPCNPLVYFGYQVLVVAALLALSFLLALGISFPLHMPGLFTPLLVLFYISSFYVLLAGPANRNNSNNNTSGVAALLSLMDRLPRAQRKNVCFVFFDDREKGLIGSGAFRRRHLAELRDDMVNIDLDCVGDGDTLVLVPSKRCRWNGPLLDTLRESIRGTGGKVVDLRLGGYFLYPADCKRFRNHVFIGAFRRKPFLGYYISRIHTRRDTRLDRENVRLLAEGLCRLLEASL